ncbi:hypothetical protein [Streptomyces sp. NPDC058145]|uniref:hypothetical protein n=1 Tax=Streptomyces sp. NPDC058145 TaxID=3346356 RepID=UPI0036E5BEB7
MDVASLHRRLSYTLLDLERAIERHAVAEATDLHALAWLQVAEAPPSESRKQRQQLQSFKAVLNSRSWQEEGRRRAAAETQRVVIPGPTTTARPSTRPAEKPARLRPPRLAKKPPKVTGVSRSQPQPRPQSQSHAAVSVPHRPARPAAPPLLEAGRLSEISTELRPLLEQIARMGATTSWSLILKRLPALPRLHRDDESVILWLVDEDRQQGEPLLSALVTVGNRQMHPRFPVIAGQLGLPYSGNPTEQQTAWSYEVLRVHQYWRYKRP